MGEFSQNEILILIEDENETNCNETNIEEYVERVESENVQTKSRVEKKVEQIMKCFCKNYIFKEKSRKNIIKTFYVRHFIV
jgi:hypothetical protein